MDKATTTVSFDRRLARHTTDVKRRGAKAMKVNEVMTRDVRIASPSETIRQAAQTMAEIDAGAIPVGENDRLVGMITDRDIAVRAVASGKSPDTMIREVMSTESICYCFDDQEISDVAASMADVKVRRLPVVNRDKRLVGILSLGDISQADDQGQPAEEALRGICEPGGQHSQSAEGQLQA
jgi:CBS domain-containing protein